MKNLEIKWKVLTYLELTLIGTLLSVNEIAKHHYWDLSKKIPVRGRGGGGGGLGYRKCPLKNFEIVGN